MNERIEILFQRYFSGTATGKEEQELWELLEDPGNSEQLQHVLSQAWQELERPDPLFAATDPARLSQIIQTTRIPSAHSPVSFRRIPFLRRWGWVAASILLVVTAVSVFLVVSSDQSPADPGRSIVRSQEIAPGKDGAVLTLADGRQVVLDSLGNGVVNIQNGSRAVIRNGELVYDLTGESTAETAYNTMTTPKGRQFGLVLPDGTRVWLNAASSIRYPTVFSGKERRVTVKGEVYFEVAKNAQSPFRVNVNDKAEVEVLGTHFNVNAYENEECIQTTLLEGSVKVFVREKIPQDSRSSKVLPSGRSAVTLKPGQQAQIQTQQAIKVLNNADVEKVMAWKNGLFNFADLRLEEVMRQLERWYDIEVVYEKGIPDIRFWGEMTKDVTLNGLLIGLEGSGVHFKIEGRKLIVLP